MKRTAALIATILLSAGCSITPAEPETVEVIEEQQSAAAAPDQIGQLLSVAEANLELEGFTVEAVSDNGKAIFDKGNWTVSEQSQNGNTVLLTVSKDAPSTEDEPEPEAEPEETTSQGLTAFMATRACGDIWETALKNQFPASKVKVHTWAGILAQTLDPEADSWFIKIEASVDSNTVNVECEVTGTDDNPTVEPLAAY